MDKVVEMLIPDNTITTTCPSCKGNMVYPLKQVDIFAKFPVDKCIFCGTTFKFGQSFILEWQKMNKKLGEQN